ncbi:MAG: NADPH-dependent 2,4-dienoyl-CoA reductase [Candidatus Odyssella sp.]|nr:NADPH-dependent 2,4-dienoyl-CoA reductase [Candidatus Odyssella sp.]
MTAYPHLFTPIAAGPFTLPNRIVMGSMHTGLEGERDAVSRIAAFYAARARGGTALIVTGGYGPNRAGRMTPHPAFIGSRDDAMALKPVADAVRAEGGRILLQLLHSGRYGYHDDIVAPTAIKSPINKAVPRALAAAEVAQTIEDYAAAAAYAREAGFDGVEIMGSEGYLISQFLAARTNQRSDEWGGSFENRLRFPVEVVKRVRARLGRDALLMYRISALELVDGGLGLDEIKRTAAAVEAAGADILNTGIGWHEAQIPTINQAVPRGGYAWAAGLVKPAVTIPVVASNRINAPETAEALVAAGQADMVSLARALLADEAFANKAKGGDRAGINICIACNQACLDHYFTFKPVTCLVNPRALREEEFAPAPARAKKRVAVIGGGLAGMAAASAAAERGHAVTLYEAAAELGGQFNLAKRVPGKQEFAESVAFFAERMRRAGVAVKLGARADAAALKAAGVEHAIVASGIAPRALAIPGAGHAKVVSYVDLLSGRAQAGPRVAIVGGGGIGFDVALFLVERASRTHLDPAAFAAHWGIDLANAGAGGLKKNGHAAPPPHAITMLKRSPGTFGRTLGKTTGWVHRLALQRAGVRFLDGVAYRSVDDRGLHVARADGTEECIAADTVVVCAGQEPLRALDAGALGALGIGCSYVGGAHVAAELDAKRAIEEGTRAGLAL